MTNQAFRESENINHFSSPFRGNNWILSRAKSEFRTLYKDLTLWIASKQAFSMLVLQLQNSGVEFKDL